ncbi:DUF2793 domain-containing protein [Aurantiacibacter aquimixticola]|uniref:DUF2793 domain-containing protein n=1 Tax=Aurantiacibacter aquimixticola TaxID=1958945 RepID=A0A419RV68_9SPHN|nr:DUF2793 domain-containing protein [Aurantiacibacter aquimixticola]RJY09681.1 DUF2793 domain-containing protein [Aurantiacibacter aquimixticola]
MTEPISFTSATPRFDLPNLFVAQAQKESFINEALARIDALLHCAVQGESDAPPSAPTDGECWLVGDQPTGDWVHHPGAIACRQAGNWLFAQPRNGMKVFDISTGASIRFDNGWRRAGIVSSPSGGTTEDSEARAAIVELIAALTEAGILPHA